MTEPRENNEQETEPAAEPSGDDEQLDQTLTKTAPPPAAAGGGGDRPDPDEDRDSNRPTLQADVEVIAEDMGLWDQPSPVPQDTKPPTTPAVSFSMEYRQLSTAEKRAGGLPTEAPADPDAADSSLSDRPTREVSVEQAAVTDLLTDPEATARGRVSPDLFAMDAADTLELPAVDVLVDDLEADCSLSTNDGQPLPSGPMSSRAVLHLLAAIGMKNESVVVIFEQEEKRRQATFVKGHLCHFATNECSEPYHQHLLNHNLITRLEYEMAMALAQKRDSDLVEVLLSTTVLDEAAVAKSKNLFLRDALLELFGWNEGWYHCQLCSSAKETSGSLDALAVLWLGTCRRIPPARALEWMYLNAASSVSLVRLPDDAISRLDLPTIAERTLQDLPLDAVLVEEWVNECARQNRHDRYQATVALFLAYDLGWISVEAR